LLEQYNALYQLNNVRADLIYTNSELNRTLVM